MTQVSVLGTGSHNNHHKKHHLHVELMSGIIM